MEPETQRLISGLPCPYGDGNTSERVASILEEPDVQGLLHLDEPDLRGLLPRDSGRGVGCRCVISRPALFDPSVEGGSKRRQRLLQALAPHRPVGRLRRLVADVVDLRLSRYRIKDHLGERRRRRPRCTRGQESEIRD